MRLKELIDSQTGATPVVLVIGKDRSKKVIKLPHNVSFNEALIQDLSSIFGEPAVKYQ
jgi:hypothetical protein